MIFLQMVLILFLKSPMFMTIGAFNTQILAASVRHTMHIIDCAKIGADVMTGPLSSIKGLLKHPLTDIGLEKFLLIIKRKLVFI